MHRRLFMRSPTEQTFEAMLASMPPDGLHFFATDCAQRACTLAQRREDTWFRWWPHIVQLKRSWITDPSLDKQLQAVRKELLKVRPPLWLILRSATGKDAKRAAETTAHESSRYIRQVVHATQPPRENLEYTSLLAHLEHQAEQEADWERARCLLEEIKRTKDKIRNQEAEDLMAVIEQEQKWQVRRLSWWFELSQITERLWLAYEKECPLPIPENASITHGLPQQLGYKKQEPPP